MKCMEVITEHMFVDIGARRVKPILPQIKVTIIDRVLRIIENIPSWVLMFYKHREISWENLWIN